MGRGWIADVAMLEAHLVTEKSDRGELGIWYSIHHDSIRTRPPYNVSSQIHRTEQHDLVTN